MSKQEPLTIIMIEDDEGHATLIERNIRRAGVSNEIVKFASGQPALDYLIGGGGKPGVKNGKPYMVLLDLNLPDMSGVDILKQLKETPKTERIPVIVLTTTDDKNEIQRCYDLGANVYVTKPVNYENFANAIRQLGLFFSVVQVPEL
ncbi:response regulator [Dongia sp.]|uniref:response regulator n=1 Tax=Dongia sp. TaxID=1977262 RepID=UPI003751F459